jgi:hypothetical protein
MPQQMKYTAAISTCFKATSLLNRDGGNIAHGFCEQWGHENGLIFKYENSESTRNGAHASTLNEQVEQMTTAEECEEALEKRLAEFRRNSLQETKVGTKLVVLDLFNGIVPSKVSASKFTTLKFVCSTPWCFDKHE